MSSFHCNEFNKIIKDGKWMLSSIKYKHSRLIFVKYFIGIGITGLLLTRYNLPNKKAPCMQGAFLLKGIIIFDWATEACSFS
jgi:hypothetical protein